MKIADGILGRLAFWLLFDMPTAWVVYYDNTSYTESCAISEPSPS